MRRYAYDNTRIETYKIHDRKQERAREIRNSSVPTNRLESTIPAKIVIIVALHKILDLIYMEIIMPKCFDFDKY